eukprot:1141185-Pyramimonas_sp.AAC.1
MEAERLAYEERKRQALEASGVVWREQKRVKDIFNFMMGRSFQCHQILANSELSLPDPAVILVLRNTEDRNLEPLDRAKITIAIRYSVALLFPIQSY